MQQNSTRFSTFFALMQFMNLLYHSIVRDIRKADGNAIRGILNDILTSATMIVVFYFMISLMGMRTVAVRGNFVLYIMSGIFLYMTHIKAVKKVSSSGGPTNPMLKHRPVTTLLLICANAISALYSQVIAIAAILLVTHVAIEPVVIYNPKVAALMVILAWFSGVAIGLLFLALTPFFPNVMPIVTTLYQRANMIFSGKMFLASTMPGYLLPIFMWNPLFHIIDQARGAVFINYTARVTNFQYPIYMTCAIIVIGMMFEHWSRKYVSESWAART